MKNRHGAFSVPLIDPSTSIPRVSPKRRDYSQRVIYRDRDSQFEEKDARVQRACSLVVVGPVKTRVSQERAASRCLQAVVNAIRVNTNHDAR